MELKNYQKYRWFFTSSGNLVVGGKSALQNDEIINVMKGKKIDFTIMHTSSPGSPFSIIFSEEEPSTADLHEGAIFTASFSKAWKNLRKNEEIHIFKISQLKKGWGMKTGTWGVVGAINKISVKLGLVLTKQKGKLRGVPEESVKSKKDILLRIYPGKIDKVNMLPKISMELEEGFSQDEILSALPAGGLEIVKKKI